MPTRLYRTYQGFGEINQQENTTNGNYNGFQTGLRVQNKWGLSGEIDYTWSHEIDITSYDLNRVSNPWNLKYDKGSGALDRRQILNVNYIYKLPFFTKSSGLTKSLLGGWEIAGTILDQTGVHAGSNQTALAFRSTTIRSAWAAATPTVPTRTPRPTTSRQSTSGLTRPDSRAPIPAWAGGPNQGFGNASKDSVVGPGRVNFTTSLYKSFSMTERAHIELRFESFNTFNHTQSNGL